MRFETLRDEEEFHALRAAAARLGKNEKQIQGPGGNVSFKKDGAMLVKASGTWLADARRQDIFALIDCEAMKRAVIESGPKADDPSHFLISGSLRPSIETGFHAALEARIVLHTHCIETLAASTQAIAQEDLDALNLVFVPYLKPGVHLARAILEVWQPETKGAVLANHGLIAVGETVGDAEVMIDKCARHFGAKPGEGRKPCDTFARTLDGSGWQALGECTTTSLAFNRDLMKVAAGAPLFPDQVIFLGPETLVSHLPLPDADSSASKLVIVPDQGVAIPQGATPALLAVAHMLGDVVCRLPKNATRLVPDEVSELLGWDAEKYRQALENDRAARVQFAS